METKPSRLLKSADILHTVPLFIVGAFLIDVIFYSDLRVIGPVFYFLCFAAKIYLFSGIYGFLIELASEENMVGSFRGFKNNAKSFWKIYLALSLGVFVLQQIFFGSLRHFFAISTTASLSYLDVLLYYFAARILISQKYLKPMNLSPRPIKINFRDAILLTILVNIEFLLRNIGAFTGFDITAMTNVIILASIYIHLLIFVYIATLIIDTYPEIEKAHNKDRILYLINPLSGGIMSGAFSTIIRSYPPAFAILQALTPKHYKTRVFNRFPWRDRYYKPGKLVAITSYTSNIAESYKIAKEFRKRGSKVVMGGPHVTYHPDEALDFCDAVVIGEAEGVWKDVIKDFENNSLQPKYMGPALEDWHSEVHKELLNFPPEIVKDCIEATRGCKFHCDFCTIPSLSGGKTRHKPIHEIVELIEKVKPYYKQVNILDNNIYSNPTYAKDLFKALIPLKVKWTTASTMDIVKNEETIKLAKESGCSQFLFGYEIFGGSLEMKQRGKFGLADKYVKFTKRVKELGIGIKGTFIFGFDSDSFKNLFKLWRFCFSIYPFFTNLGILTPLPGSRLYHQMLAEDRTTNLNWRNYDCHQLVFRQNHLGGLLTRPILPYFKYFFLLTTSKFGNILLLLIIFAFLLTPVK